ncbi:unnamed protein product, partial [Adineta steineri]
LIDLNDLFEKALVENQVNFIQLFLDHDFSINDLFHNTNKLVDLYENEFNDSLKSVYTEIIQPLLGNVSQLDEDDDLPKNSFTILSNNEIDINKELFLWSVLTGRQELALLFWTRGRNKICTAFIAILIYKSKTRTERNIKYEAWIDKFEHLAVQILERFYLTNPYKCKQAIVRAIPEYDNVTWLQLAVIAESKLFIAQQGVQDVLHDIWYGRIDRRVSHSLIIFSSFMLPYSGFLTYSEELIEGSNKYNEPDSSQYYIPRLKTTIDKMCNESDTTCSRLIGDDFNVDYKKSGIKQYIGNISIFLHAPYVKYLYNLYSHVIFLLLFSYVLLCDYFPLYEYQSNYGPSMTELILILWVFTLLCEEIRQIRAKKTHSMYGKLQSYFTILWNKLDTFAIILFFITCILRFLPVSGCFNIARTILAIDLSIWYIRTLDIFSAVKRLGPKLVMIGEMVHDLTFFMLMLTVFVLAFGVPTYSLLNDVQKFSWHMPRRIINLAYWQIFELQIVEDIEKNYELNGYVMFFLLIVYITVASVLLINLLIAMFSNTFDRLHMDTDCIWKFQQYSLVCYQLKRPLFPPPFIIISHIWRIIIYVFSHSFKIKWFYMKYIKQKNQAKFKISVNKLLTKQLEEIEDALGNEVYFISLKANQKQIEYSNDFNEERVYSSQEIVLTKIKTLENEVQSVQNQQINMFQYLEYLMNGMKKIGGDDIEMPQRCQDDFELI